MSKNDEPFISKTINVALKTRNCVFKMMNFAVKREKKDGGGSSTDLAVISRKDYMLIQGQTDEAVNRSVFSGRILISVVSLPDFRGRILISE